ncbi:BGTF surface domain-containing protein [Halorussus lipolyticus]|uniref:BGTF surface domain-containing protein n=1 Tax=Halorussus lipolyticus TaxID=3034024 RepID=UPI0023E7DF2F|nr:BGTF surface domain-containing protein [Halorussus sp. DT80]
MTVPRSTFLTAAFAVLLVSAGVLGSAAHAVEASADTTTTTDAAGDATILSDGETLVLQPEENQTIRGETTLEPGTNLSVMVRGDDPKLLKTNVVTVTKQGTFSANFDFSAADGAQIEVRVYRGDAQLATASGEVACGGGCADATTTDSASMPTTETTAESDGLLDRFTSGVGMIALGSVLAIAGIGVVLGLFRT